VSLTWHEVITFVAAQPPVIALSILLFELVVFGLGLVLGHNLAIRER
jgi:hypothetical protein